MAEFLRALRAENLRLFEERLGGGGGGGRQRGVVPVRNSEGRTYARWYADF
ncbi:hypothetical protein Kpho01_31600 [Kitasatospora phosalacinea]|uniref:Uncharacterized protein n=1 Tax=Kitasatospora phosalacinea TaxID=2065 RepID=A0A9W6PFP0_9ACTN|nr:hypothetical protein Kpho01_31600 [Kitasatospora phosalacinea]